MTQESPVTLIVEEDFSLNRKSAPPVLMPGENQHLFDKYTKTMPRIAQVLVKAVEEAHQMFQAHPSNLTPIQVREGTFKFSDMLLNFGDNYAGIQTIGQAMLLRWNGNDLTFGREPNTIHLGNPYVAMTDAELDESTAYIRAVLQTASPKLQS